MHSLPVLVHAVAEEHDAAGLLRSPLAQVSLRLVWDERAGEGDYLLGELVPLDGIAVQLMIEDDRRPGWEEHGQQDAHGAEDGEERWEVR